jgi:sterol 14alpha-demethylase
MGLANNGTSFSVPWISETYGIMPPIRPSFLDSAPAWVLLVGAFFGLQILAVVLNVLRQLVSTPAGFLRAPSAGRQKP